MHTIAHQLGEMPIDSYITIADAVIVRTANTHFMVLRGGGVEHIGWGHYSVGYAIALTVESLTGIPQVRPCSKCGQPTGKYSHCPACNSDSVQQVKARKRERGAA